MPSLELRLDFHPQKGDQTKRGGKPGKGHAYTNAVLAIAHMTTKTMLQHVACQLGPTSTRATSERPMLQQTPCHCRSDPDLEAVSYDSVVLQASKLIRRLSTSEPSIRHTNRTPKRHPGVPDIHHEEVLGPVSSPAVIKTSVAVKGASASVMLARIFTRASVMISVMLQNSQHQQLGWNNIGLSRN